MSATDPRPTPEQLAALKEVAVTAYQTEVSVEDVSAYWSERPNMSFNGARKHVGIHRAVEASANPLVAHGLEHAAQFLRTRDFANMDPKVVVFAESLAEEFTARAAALVNGEYKAGEQASA